MHRYSGYFFTAVWSFLFLYDVIFGLPEIQQVIYLGIFIATGLLGYYLKPELNKISQLIWIFILTWVMFIFEVSLLIGIESVIKADTAEEIFIVIPYMTWASLLTSIVVAIVVAPVSYLMLRNQSVIVNSVSCVFAAVSIIYLQLDVGDSYYYAAIEGAVMVLSVTGMTVFINWYVSNKLSYTS